MRRGTLFTEDFLRDGIRETADWRELDPAWLASTETALKEILAPFESGAAHNEADTEERIIYKVLDVLGWDGLILRRNAMAAKGSADVPDALLLPDREALELADRSRTPAEKFRHGIVVCESKKWELSLDGGQGDAVPSTQMLRYLTRADVMSDGRILWGVLTNGRVWRLYSQRAKSRSEQFLEFDLGALLGVKGCNPDLFSPGADEAPHFLKVFALMFRREAFLATRGAGRTFHDVALEEGRLWEARVTKDLSELTFDEVFPGFIRAIAAAAPAPSLQDVRQAALTLLYRLLFILYAEDRDLLPRRERRYEDSSLFKLRREIAGLIDSGMSLSGRAAHRWHHLRTLFHLIDEGDADIGLPTYNGGLFNRKEHGILENVEISDAELVPLLDKLSRTLKGKRLINYRDLSVQQLGSIYERLLEYEPVRDGAEITIRLNPFARKGSGSYYTPDELVALIVDQTVGPLVRERHAIFLDKANALKSARTPLRERLELLRAHDFASALLELKVCDPAMGSGHFLVRLVDYLSDAVIEALAAAPAEVSWGDYSSPLAARIAAIRERISGEAKANGWTVRDDQLEDRMIVRRMVLKRVVYGVDKNPMAVELAKVSLWLHTFTVGAPLSFLDHHLRCGDSLFGEWVLRTERELSEVAGLFVHSQVIAAKQAARGMLNIEQLADADLAEVRKSSETFEGIREDTEPLIELLDFWHACRWLPGNRERERAKEDLLQGAFGDPLDLLTGRVMMSLENGDETGAQRSKGEERGLALKQTAAELLEQATQLAWQERFLHWEVAFPGVWADWESNDPKGGFDAVIGNPPWDRLKMQEVEWFAARKPEIALAQRAADRKRMIESLKKAKDPLYAEYRTAVAHADMALALARDSGEYPLLGRGDANIYSLFVERAQRLLKPDGIAGLLVPSGIASDKSAAEFFRSIAISGRLIALLDFENRGREGENFFPDVDSRFKFCAFVASGPRRASGQARCGFFLKGAFDLDDAMRVFPLTPDDFALVNPNTGTAPIFRTRRDAEIATTIYKRLPVLARRDAEGEIVESVWPVRYFTMFHMTNDSNLFWTRERLEKERAYPVTGSRWQKGKKEFVPLYVGKMVHQFDHRAASVGINANNVHVAGYSEDVSVSDHQNLFFVPTPQYWVDYSLVEWPSMLSWCLSFRDIARSTDERTFIGAIVPKGAYGNTLPLVLSDDTAALALLLANLNSQALDYVARQKIQSTHANWYIVEQLPVLGENAYTRKFGKRKASDIVRDHVLRLSYTAHDLREFARDMGHVDRKTAEALPPFKWDEEERAHLRARLDALYFLLYGITDRDDVRYILESFPIVREHDEKAFGRYRTRDLVLAYMNALEAGDADTVVAL